jgi:spermidine/putrescine transport system ATP-binding protein
VSGDGAGSPADRETAIRLEAVRKSFGDINAVRDLSLDVHEGEFITLLGPSGCGKTTTMRMIAGFEEPDAGRIYLRGRDVIGMPPNKREVNMCFQHYALFPHMTVEQNVAYGLKLKKVPKDERRRRVVEMLEVVRLPGYEKRKPGQLSGGQQQRVALARALVNRPAALLLDEPLGALDVKLRKQMQLELKRIQLELGTTFVYVTHDQEEALSMSDRIAVMNDGVIEQLDEPRAIYQQPATPFVADFVGVLNAMEVRVDDVQDLTAIMRVGNGQRIEAPAPTGATVGSRLIVTVRPERVRVRPIADGRADGRQGSRLEGVIGLVVYLGTITQFHVDTSLGPRLIAHVLSGDEGSELREGETVALGWDREDGAVVRDAGE